MIFQTSLNINTKGRSTHEITPMVEQQLEQSGIRNGLCNVFIRHTSASLIICENADPGVRSDLETFFSSLIIDGDPAFRHDTEGKDDMPAHIRTILTDASLTIPVTNARLALGTWQGIYVYEHRYQDYQRHIFLTFFGE